MKKITAIWKRETNGKPQDLSSKEHEAAVKRTMTEFINGENATKGKELLNKALKGAKGKKKTKKKKTKKKRKGGKRKSMKRNKRSRRKRKGRKKRR